MQLYFKNKLMTIGGSSTVVDQDQNIVYKVKGRILSPTKYKKIYDQDGKLLFIVKNKLVRFFNTTVFIMDAKKNKLATVTQKYFSVGKYEVKDSEDEIEIQKDGVLFHYTVFFNGNKFAEFKRGKFLALTDNILVDVEDPSQAGLAVAFAVCFDNVNDRRAKDSN
ncbi:MAG: LURP-one-related family protein [Eubacteriales bacterium]|nr:LURP-one-related family protein [Eubacteriales bacterium]